MKLGCIQCFQKPDAWNENVKKACYQAFNLIDRHQPDIIIFPEAFPHYISESVIARGDTLVGQTIIEMKKIAAKGNCLVLFGMIRDESDGLHNSAILVNSTNIIDIYDKTHLAYYPKEKWRNEQSIFIQGNKLGLFNTKYGKIGVMVCHDGLYPELVRALVLEGSEIIFWLLNDGNVIDWAVHYSTWAMTPIVVVNIANRGASAIIDGNGKVIAESLNAEISELVSELDLEKWKNLRSKGEGRQAFYRVRRPELYGALTRPYYQAKNIPKQKKQF